MMKRKKISEMADAVLLAFGLSACSSLDSDNRREMVASYTAHPIRLDGKLEDPAWLIFFGRYNYGRYLCICENSSFPSQRDINYHAHADYARLKLVK